jgi:hypothetical protein
MEADFRTAAAGAWLSRTKLETATLAVTVVSAVGCLGSIALLEPDEESSTFASILGAVMLYGWLLSLVLGVVSWIWGSRKRERRTARAGKIAVGYVLLSFLLFLFVVLGQGMG